MTEPTTRRPLPPAPLNNGWSDPEPEPWLPRPSESFDPEPPAPVRVDVAAPPVAPAQPVQAPPQHHPVPHVVVEARRRKPDRAGGLRDLEWPRRAARWVRAHPVTASAWAVVLVHVAVFATACWHGYFEYDDFQFETWSATSSLFSKSFLLQSHDGHLMPGGFFVTWILTKVAPLNWAVMTAVMTAGVAAVDAAVYALLRELFGRRPAVLVLLTLFCFSSFTTMGDVWYAAAIQQIPGQIALAVGLRYAIRHFRTRRPRDAYFATASMVGGVLFYEKVLAFIPLFAIVALLFFASGTVWNRLRSAVLDFWRLWASIAVLALLYGGFYFHHVHNPFRTTEAGGSQLHIAHNLILRSFIPTALGGPWRTTPVGQAGSIADTPPQLAWVALVVAVCVVGASLILRRSAWRAWTFLALWLAIDVLLVTTNRVGATFGLELRHLTDMAIATVVCFGLAFLPYAGDPLVDSVTPPEWREVALARHWLGANRRALAAGLFSAVFVGSAVSNASVFHYWQAPAPRAFMTTAIPEVSHLPAGTALVDASVPSTVLWGVFYTETLPSNLFRPLKSHPTPLTVADDLVALDSSGHLVPAVVSSLRAPVVPAGGCGFQAGTQPLAIPVDQTIDFGWVIHIAYVAEGLSHAQITAGRTIRNVTFQPGSHDLYLAVQGVVTSIDVSPLDNPSAVVCAHSVVLGTASAAPGQ